MNKQTQQSINQIIMEAWKQFTGETANSDIIHESPLHSCSAWVRRYEDIDGNFSKFVGLKSSSAIIAVFDTENNIFYDVSRMVCKCTATNTRHIAKFYSDIVTEHQTRENVTTMTYYPA